MYRLIIRILLAVLMTLGVDSSVVLAAPSEVLSDVRILERGGIPAIRIDFAIPVHYKSHAPVKSGSTLNIYVEFNRAEVPDVSQLPLLQSMIPVEKDKVPLIDVTYMTQNDEPMLVLQFEKEVTYNISQVMGITSLVVFILSESKQVVETVKRLNRPIIAAEGSKAPFVLQQPALDVSDEPVAPVGQPDIDVPDSPATSDEEAKTETAAATQTEKPQAVEPQVEGSRVAKMLKLGIKELRKRRYKRAIRIFSAIISEPDASQRANALELLAISRERNGQLAQAKANYEQYLDEYKEGQGVVRVRQRLADLIESELKPKKKLAKSEREKKSKKVSQNLIASVTQSVSRSSIKVDGESQRLTGSYFDTDLRLEYRLKKGDFRIRNVLSLDHSIDLVDGEQDDVELNRIYSKFKNTKTGLQGIVGRQSSSSSGVFSRFDGIWVAKDAWDTFRFNASYGYIVDSSHKTKVQLDNPFVNLGVNLTDYWKGWDIDAYVHEQRYDDVLDRRAVGTVVRYFNSKGSFSSDLDYDVSFNELNLVTLRGSYRFEESTSVDASIAKRRSPLLLTSNVLTYSDIDEFDELLLFYNEDDLQTFVDDRTGESLSATLTFNHTVSKNLQLNGSYSQFTSTYIFNVDQAERGAESLADPTLDESESKSKSYTLGAVLRDIWDEKDSAIARFTFNERTDSDGLSLSLNYRMRFSRNFRLNTALGWTSSEYSRSNGAEYKVESISPNLNLNYNINRAARVFFNLRLRQSDYSGETNTEDNLNIFTYLGYDYEFDFL